MSNVHSFYDKLVHVHSRDRQQRRESLGEIWLGAQHHVVARRDAAVIHGKVRVVRAQLLCPLEILTSAHKVAHSLHTTMRQ